MVERISTGYRCIHCLQPIRPSCRAASHWLKESWQLGATKAATFILLRTWQPRCLAVTPRSKLGQLWPQKAPRISIPANDSVKSSSCVYFHAKRNNHPQRASRFADLNTHTSWHTSSAVSTINRPLKRVRKKKKKKSLGGRDYGPIIVGCAPACFSMHVSNR